MTDALDRRPGLPAADLHEGIREAAFALLRTERRGIAPAEVRCTTRIRTGVAHADGFLTTYQVSRPPVRVKPATSACACADPA